MMTLWCMMRSPLMIGAEMTKNDDFTLRLLTNREVLAIGRDSWSAHPLYTRGDRSVWVAPARDGSCFWLALFNLSDEPQEISVFAREMDQPGPFSVKELWSGKEAGKTDAVTALLSPHDAAVYRVTPA